MKPLVSDDEDFGKPGTYLFEPKSHDELEAMSNDELETYGDELRSQWDRIWFVIKWARNMAKEERAKELEPLLQEEMLRVGRLTDRPFPAAEPWVDPRAPRSVVEG